MYENITLQSILGCLTITLVFILMLFPAYKVKKIKKKTYLMWAFFVFYFSYLIYLTIVCRETSDRYSYRLSLFWSYHAIFSGAYIRLVEIAGNIALFIPIGHFLSEILKNKFYTILIGTGLSLLIESIQLITRRGMFVIDDIIHNMVGVIVGVCFYTLIQFILFKKNARLGLKG